MDLQKKTEKKMTNKNIKSNGSPYLLIEGGKPIKGTLKAKGAKNATLPIMAGTILAPGKITLNNVPNISDVRNMAQIIKFLGARIDFTNKNQMIIDTSNLKPSYAPYQMVKKLNASFDITGAMVARFGEAHVPLPGGCVIGTRAVDQHLEGFKALGCEVNLEPGGFIEVKSKNLIGTKIRFKMPSVGATKNVMMAACLARGKTILDNAAREPEVVDLANFLNSCGANISGQGSSQIHVNGVKEMYADNINYLVIPDRIEVGTYLLAAAITQGELKITGINPEYLNLFLKKLIKAGQKIETGKNYISIKGEHPIKKIGAIITEPYPGFPTDLQPQMVSLLSLSEGISFVREKIFDMRFKYIDDLRRMGANISMQKNTAVIKGVKKLMGAPVDAPDIRAGGALIIAALAAEGTSQIYGLNYIDRGYEKIEETLTSLGASIRRINEYAYRD